MAWPSDIEKVILGAAADLDDISSFSDPLIPLPPDDAACVLIIRTYAEVFAEICHALNLLGEPEPTLLLARWAEEIALLVPFWHRGDPLARRNFRSIALDCLLRDEVTL